MLASASPARRRLLEQAGIPHQVRVSGVDESSIIHADPTELVLLLAKAKAEAVAQQLKYERSADPLLSPIKAVLGCDSVFEFNGQIFGKPLDASIALRRWQLMSGESGLLHTGHVLLTSTTSNVEKNGFDHVIKKTVTTRVHFAALNQLEIEAYIATGEPLQCAGGFALEGRGSLFISGLEGCYSNVIGLSLPWLRQSLHEVPL